MMYFPSNLYLLNKIDLIIKFERYYMSTSKYMGRVDPIQVLRNSMINSKKIRQKGKFLQFQKDIKVLLKTPTAWLSPITNKQYTIGAIWLFLDCKDKTQYLTKATEFDVQMINIADKEEIEKYFTGKIQQSNCINQQLKLQLLTKTAKRDQPVGGLQADSELKKKEIQLPFELKVIDYVLRTQRPTGSKTRSLRCPSQSFHFFLDLLRQKSQPQNQKDTQIKSKLNRIYERKKLPIIIVPEAIQAGNISLSNIQKFLIQGHYQEPKQLKNTIQRKIQMQYTIKGKKILFEVTNNPSLLSLADWQNVVGVFILGQRSEFSSWTIREPSQIFKKARGFLLKYSNISKQEANDWNVKTFIIERNARYRDQEIQKKIWGQIEQFLFQKS